MSTWLGDIKNCLSSGPFRYGQLVDAYCKSAMLSPRTAKARLGALEDAIRRGKVQEIEIVRRGPREVWFGLRDEPRFEQKVEAFDRAAQVVAVRSAEIPDDEGAIAKEILTHAEYTARTVRCHFCSSEIEAPTVKVGPIEVAMCFRCGEAFLLPPRREYLDRRLTYRDAWLLANKGDFLLVARDAAEFVRQRQNGANKQDRQTRGRGRILRRIRRGH